MKSATPRPAPRSPVRIAISVHLADNVDEAIAALCADDNLYQRAGKLVTVARLTRAEARTAARKRKGRERLPAGTPQIRVVTAATLRERLTRVAYFQRRKGKEWIDVLPTDVILHAVLARGEWPGIRPIVGIIETPTLRVDGSVFQTPGYDEATGYVYVPSTHFPRVPERPTRAQARAALRALQEVFCDFPYIDPAHANVPIAATLTLLSRPAIKGAVPGFLFDASTRGSGKTLQEDAIATIVTGRTAPKMNYPANDEELEKVLGAYALRGAALICLDNVTRTFGGGPMDRVLTARDDVELRVLGRSEIPTLPWLAVILASGNNLQLGDDTVRRVLMGRIESPLENPETRTKYRHRHLLQWVRREGPRLVVAGLTLLRAFVAAKRPTMGCATWGSFEEWSEFIPPAIIFAGGADPMLARPARVASPEARALACIVAELPRVGDVDGVTARHLIDRLYPDGSAARKDGCDDLREAIEALCPTRPGSAPSSTTLGKRLASFKGRVIGDRKIQNVPGHAGVVRWCIVNTDGRPIVLPAPGKTTPPTPPTPPTPRGNVVPIRGRRAGKPSQRAGPTSTSPGSDITSPARRGRGPGWSKHRVERGPA